MNTGINGSILKEIKTRSHKFNESAGCLVTVIRDSDAKQIADKYNRTLNEIYIESLSLDIWPHRYIRNQDTLSSKEQQKLSSASVTVIGCGGLGGHVLLMLARIGIGALVAVDPDLFEESNLNRQAFANSGTLGKHKTAAAATALKKINPAVSVKEFQTAINHSNTSQIICESDIVVDALDNIPDRKILINAAQQIKIPIVHGSVAGFEGQVMSILPDDSAYGDLFDSSANKDIQDMDAECTMGVPSITPVFISSLQAMEVVKILLNRGNRFSRRMLYSDIEIGEFNCLKFTS